MLLPPSSWLRLRQAHRPETASATRPERRFALRTHPGGDGSAKLACLRQRKQWPWRYLRNGANRCQQKKPTWLDTLWVLGHVGLLFSEPPLGGAALYSVIRQREVSVPLAPRNNKRIVFPSLKGIKARPQPAARSPKSETGARPGETVQRESRRQRDRGFAATGTISPTPQGCGGGPLKESGHPLFIIMSRRPPHRQRHPFGVVIHVSQTRRMWSEICIRLVMQAREEEY
jgi:hypothetical protein